MASVEDRFWSGFNPANMSQKHRDRLMNDVYSGYKTRSVSVRGQRGKYGYGPSTTANVTHYDYYNGRGWDEVGQHIGIKNVNSSDEIRRLYDYMHGYKPQAPKAAKKPAPKPARKRQTNLPTKAKAVKFDTSKYDKQIKSLSGSLKSLQKKLLSNQSKYSKSLKSQQTNFESLFAKQNKKYKDSTAAQAALMKEQTKKYDENMSSLRSSIAETMSSSQQPAVGVKTGAYGKQSAALQRQGVRGSFGRTGLRIKKGIQDKSLNI